MASFLFSSCHTDLHDPALDFLGDSIVARWDINQDFPSFYVYNYGVWGSGIELLNSYRSKFDDGDVVVISGTNDNSRFMQEFREAYAKEYIDAILTLTRKRIFLFSVLPREHVGDRQEINNDIKAFNAIVSAEVAGISRITYLDVFPDFMKDGSVCHGYFSDGLHPNVIGYEILTQKLLNAL